MVFALNPLYDHLVKLYTLRSEILTRPCFHSLVSILTSRLILDHFASLKASNSKSRRRQTLYQSTVAPHDSVSQVNAVRDVQPYPALTPQLPSISTTPFAKTFGTRNLDTPRLVQELSFAQSHRQAAMTGSSRTGYGNPYSPSPDASDEDRQRTIIARYAESLDDWRDFGERQTPPPNKSGWYETEEEGEEETDDDDDSIYSQD